MKSWKLIILVVFVLLAGCSGLNQFESNTFVRYVDITDGGAGKGANGNGTNNYSKIIPYRQSINDMDQHMIKKGDCIVVDLVGGFLHWNYEDVFEKIFSIGPVRNELSLSITAYELWNLQSVTYDQQSGKRTTPDREQNLLLFTGQLAGRPLGVEYFPVYGPRIYNGGELVFEVNLTELDEDEMEELGTKITEFGEKLSEKGKEKGQEWTTIDSKLIQFLSTGILKISTGDLAGIGFDAALSISKIYTNLHKENDGIIQHFFTLTSPGRANKEGNQTLREGYFVLVRANVGQDENAYAEAFDKATFNPEAMKLKSDYYDKDKDKCLTWLAFRVSKYKKGECPCKDDNNPGK